MANKKKLLLLLFEYVDGDRKKVIAYDVCAQLKCFFN